MAHNILSMSQMSHSLNSFKSLSPRQSQQQLPKELLTEADEVLQGDQDNSSIVVSSLELESKIN